MDLQFKNLDQSEYFKQLSNLRGASLHEVLSAERVREFRVKTGGGLTYSYAAKAVDRTILDTLQRLADDQQLVDKYRAAVNGEFMNTGENRMVLHHLLRGRVDKEVRYRGRDMEEFYNEQHERVRRFVEAVHAGTLKSSTKKQFETVVQIGIGGSDLGPRALYLALNAWTAERTGSRKMEARFISNVDPDDPGNVLEGLDLEKTLFVLVSKSGTTQETLTNMNFVIRKMEELGIPGLDPTKHMVAVTSETSPLAQSPDFLDAFFIDDFIGGRYSATSAVGGVVLSLAYGYSVFAKILEGAHEVDSASLNPDIRQNAALLDALIGIFERNVLGYPVTAVLPYSQALLRFPAHLQQLDMESNGKRVSREGKPLGYATGPVVFGEPGTNGQHSFYQLLHQGTEAVPLQFIGFHKSQRNFDLEIEGSTSQTKLLANLAAQIAAFALGKEDENPNKYFPGERPSSLIYGRQLTPESLGALLAHFENKVLFQGLCWNINSFDQEGVQLGKVLTKQVLAGAGGAGANGTGAGSEAGDAGGAAGTEGQTYEVLRAYADLLGL